MTQHLQNELEALKCRLLGICAMVEKSMALAVRALQEQNAALAREVIAGDERIDMEEVHIEEEALKLLALYQPVATDLRLIVATIKINNDLERIGDLAVNIAERAERLAGQELPARRLDFAPMADRVMAMLRRGLDALFNQDEALAWQVCESDDEVDAMHRDGYQRVREAIVSGGADADYNMMCLSVSRDLERVADHATNIAQDVIYMAGGNIVRHRHRNAAAVADGPT